MVIHVYLSIFVIINLQVISWYWIISSLNQSYWVIQLKCQVPVPALASAMWEHIRVDVMYNYCFKGQKSVTWPVLKKHGGPISASTPYSFWKIYFCISFQKEVKFTNMTDNILYVYCVFLLFFDSIYPTAHSCKDLYVQLRASRKVW